MAPFVELFRKLDPRHLYAQGTNNWFAEVRRGRRLLGELPGAAARRSAARSRRSTRRWGTCRPARRRRRRTTRPRSPPSACRSWRTRSASTRSLPTSARSRSTRACVRARNLEIFRRAARRRRPARAGGRLRRAHRARWRRSATARRSRPRCARRASAASSCSTCRTSPARARRSSACSTHSSSPRVRRARALARVRARPRVPLAAPGALHVDDLGDSRGEGPARALRRGRTARRRAGAGR